MPDLFVPPVGPRPEMTEAVFQSQVLGAARSMGWLAYHTHDSRRSTAGFPDLVLLKGTRTMVLELKRDRPTGKAPTKAQREWLTAFARNPSVEAGLVRPIDWVEILQALHAHARTWPNGEVFGIDS